MQIGDDFVATASDSLLAYAESSNAKHSIKVYLNRDSGLYSIVANGKLRHKDGDAEFAIRGLMFYLQSYMNTVHR